jgi:hypothetical protein
MKPVSIWIALVAAMTSWAASAGPHAAAPPAGESAIVPAGTLVNVRLTQSIDVDLAQAGMTFRARVDDPVMIDTRIIIPREAVAVVQAVKVVQSGQFKGSDQISLKLNGLSFGGRAYQVVTEYATAEGGGEGRRTARKVGGGAGLGAIFGGVVGGGEGALVGAAVGAFAGTAVSASGEEHLRLDAETRLQFKLTSSIRIQLS